MKNFQLFAEMNANGSTSVRALQMDEIGRLKTDAEISSLTVSQASEYAEDSGHTDLDVGTFILGVRNDTLGALAGTDKDYAPIQITAAGALHVTESSASTASALVDSDGVQYSGSNPLPITAPTALSVTESAASTASALVDSGGVQYSGSNPVPITGVVDLGSNNDVTTKESPDATSNFSPTNADSSAFTSGLVGKASAGVLYEITGYNSSTLAQFINIHNKATAVDDTDVPVVTFTVPATSNFSYTPTNGKFGKFFGTGITVTNSSTAPTSTTQAADCWFNILYQ